MEHDLDMPSVLVIRYALWTVLTLIWAGIFVMSWTTDGFHWRNAVIDTGWLAWYLLIYTMFISVFARLFPGRKTLTLLLSLRKYTGVFAFLIVLSHSILQAIRVTVLGGTPVGDYIASVFAIPSYNAMIFGAAAFIAMLPAFITSTAWAVRRLGYARWKALQRLVHITFVLAAAHIAFVPYLLRGQDVNMLPLAVIASLGLGYVILLMRYGRKKRQSASAA